MKRIYENKKIKKEDKSACLLSLTNCEKGLELNLLFHSFARILVKTKNVMASLVSSTRLFQKRTAAYIQALNYSSE